MRRKPTVLLLIPHLGGGGAERVIELLACGLSPEKYRIHLALVTQCTPGSQSLAPWVSLHLLGARRVRSGAFRILRLVRRLQPDLVISGIAHLNFLILLLRPFMPRHTHILVRQNSTVSADLAFERLPAYTRFFYRKLYRRADRVICQSHAMSADLIAQAGIPPARIAVLPNPVDVEAIRRELISAPDPWLVPGPRLLAVGRLVPAKAFDLLLDALARLRARVPETALTIAGAGPLEDRLRAQCRDLNTEAAVHFAGHTDRLAPWLAHADIFVLSSRREGLPNALLEAAAAGLPIVATPASQGLTDLLQKQPGVWLAEEISAHSLALSIESALASLQPRQRFEHAWLAPFRMEDSIHAWEELLDSTLQPEPSSPPPQ
jgi:glycosyltransferase involved in cell wall biosynthesis